MKGIRVSKSRTKMTEVVLPNDTNPLGFLLGGRLLYWMDIAAAVCAQTHSHNIAVTVAIDHMEFKSPAKVGDVIEIEAQITCTFKTSMEVMIEAWKKSITSDERTKINEAYFTFVVIDVNGKALNAVPVIPENKRERELFAQAESRRKERLKKHKEKKPSNRAKKDIRV